MCIRDRYQRRVHGKSFYILMNNNRVKKYFKKLKAYFTLKNSAITLGVVFSFVAYKKYQKYLELALPTTVSLSTFLQQYKKNQIKEVLINGKEIIFSTTLSGLIQKTDAALLTKDKLFDLLYNKISQIKVQCVPILSAYQKLFQPQNLITIGLTYAISYTLFSNLLKQSFLDNNKHIKTSYLSEYRFSDLFGVEHAKHELQEIIDFLNDPSKYLKIGARLRKGVLIYGPPGTGKTLLAKATAGESQASFFYCSASEFIELYVGMGAKRVRELFNKAKLFQPSIIFIDEIDGIGMKRKSFGEEVSDTERSTTLNQLLTEMDGFSKQENIVVIAATNRILSLDDALMRSGRFDTKIQIQMPDAKEREGIIRVHLSKKQQIVSDNVIKTLASEILNISGADIENSVNESAYFAIQENEEKIRDSHLIKAFDKLTKQKQDQYQYGCLLYTSPSPRDRQKSRMPSSA
eukprot:TRINITY_DN2471_c0_g1_i1.p1 TRINITY_DN2471_c0_g1~~TRINITY_DN2471_c0_g1_i1.p1  ORF type:complete len:462 (-),score=83.58 TRINITY_DN2471_c0_g1_i1:12-1397(-)